MFKKLNIRRILRSAFIERAHFWGLILIATIAVGTHLAMDRLLLEERGKAIRLDLLGEQRMLSERIKSLSLQLAVVSDENELVRLEGYLSGAINRMRGGHETLIKGDNSRQLPGVA